MLYLQNTILFMPRRRQALLWDKTASRIVLPPILLLQTTMPFPIVPLILDRQVHSCPLLQLQVV